jgi:glycosyltransferase involved in cell wall biosynthesis
MRVAITLGGTDWGRSGIGAYVRAILPRLEGALRRNGDSLVVIGDSREIHAYSGVLAGATVLLAPPLGLAPAASALWYLFGVGAFARRAGHADVLLLPAANRRASVRGRLPTVAVVHDLAQLSVPGKYDPLRMAYLRWVVLVALRFADQLVAVSGATRDDMVAVLGQGTPVRVVSNGVDAIRFAPRSRQEPEVARVLERHAIDGPYLLYTARLEHPGKNHLRLLRAFASSELRGSHSLVLAGGDWGARRQVDEEISRAGLAGRVRLLGWVPDEELPALVCSAEAVVMAGLCEGFGLPALEALAAGRPVCAANTGALPNVVGSLAAFFDPYSEASIRLALVRVVSDHVLRARCATEGPAWAAARSWDSTVDGLVDACRAALA